MARLYESLFLLSPDLSEEQTEQHIQSVQDLVARGGGEVAEVERWGKKRLAYRVGAHRYGIYVLLRYRGGGKVVGELERHFRLNEEVFKFITVRVLERHLRKEEEMREKRVAAEARAQARRERVGAAGRREEGREEDEDETELPRRRPRPAFGARREE